METVDSFWLKITSWNQKVLIRRMHRFKQEKRGIQKNKWEWPLLATSFIKLTFWLISQDWATCYKTIFPVIQEFWWETHILQPILTGGGSISVTRWVMSDIQKRWLFVQRNSTLLKVEYNLSWVNFTHFLKKKYLLTLELIFFSSSWPVYRHIKFDI